MGGGVGSIEIVLVYISGLMLNRVCFHLIEFQIPREGENEKGKEDEEKRRMRARRGEERRRRRSRDGFGMASVYGIGMVSAWFLYGKNISKPYKNPC